jgi:hypothetical protein
VAGEVAEAPRLVGVATLEPSAAPTLAPIRGAVDPVLGVEGRAFTAPDADLGVPVRILGVVPSADAVFEPLLVAGVVVVVARSGRAVPLGVAVRPVSTTRLGDSL